MCPPSLIASAPSLRRSSLSLALLLLGRSGVLGLVLGLNLLEALDVLCEVGVLRKLDEELGLLLLAVLLAAVHRDGLRADLHELGVLVSTKDSSAPPQKLTSCRPIRYLPDEVLCAHDCGGDGVAESLELNPVVFLEELLAQEDVEVLVPLVGDVDDVGVFARCLAFHCAADVSSPFFNNAIAFLKAPLINYYTCSIL